MPARFAWLIGARVSEVAHEVREDVWLVQFGPRTELRITCPWRIAVSGSIVLGKAGLIPISNAELRLASLAEANRMLKGRAVAAAMMTGLGNLRLDLADDVVVEVLSDGAGGTGWALRGPAGARVTNATAPFSDVRTTSGGEGTR